MGIDRTHAPKRGGRTAAILTAALWTAAACGQDSGRLSAAERQGVGDTLFLANLTVEDLHYERKVFQVPYRTPLIDLCLDRPLDAADALMDLHAEANTGPTSRLLAVALQKGLGDKWPSALPTITMPAPAPPAELPGPLQVPIVNLVMAVVDAQNQLRIATKNLGEAERRRLVESLPSWATEEPSIKFDFTQNEPVEQSEILGLVDKVELWRIRAAAVDLAAAVERAAAALRQTRVSLTGVVAITLSGVRVSIGGAGPDVHSGGADIVVDLGGDDRYSGRMGAGVDGVGVLLDLGGDDTYTISDASLGCGLLGIGIARDVGGHDVVRGKSMCLGAGLAGVGLFAKEGGNDVYSATALSQGFGLFGIGMMIDSKGDDRYTLDFMGQGAARTGGFGWLIDREGSDVYRAGGLVLNSPLFKDVYYSNAQGFGDGYRLDTGGIAGGTGLLTDLGGDDFYLAETYAQAASYWFGVGTLYDANGHDTYTGYHYVQASAMHLCGAYLFDLAGDDAYVTKFGASHAIGHDYGVALLLDRSGSDIYTARDSNPGIGNANGLGIFIDAAGEDRYQGPPGRGNMARGTVSLGVFVDLSGQDRYREGLEDASGAVRAGMGVAYDVADVPTANGAGSAGATQPALPTPGSKQKPPNDELDELYRRATRWGVGTAVDDVQAAIAELVAIGMPALEWMVETHLSSASRLEQRAFVLVVGALGEDARNLIAVRVASPDDDVARVALAICIDGKIKEAGPVLSGALGRPSIQRLAVRAAGSLQSRDAVLAILPLCASPDRVLALDAMVALEQIGDDRGYETAAALLRSTSMPIRKAAIGLMAKSPERAIATAKGLSGDTDEKVARLAIELLALVGTPEALAEAASKLIDPRPGVRIQALLALDGRCPQANKAVLLSLRNDPIPSVRAVAQRIDPGR